MDQESQSVLVLGASGRFGRAAVEAFARAGWKVLAQSRSPLPYALPPGARSLVHSLTSLAGTLAKLGPVDAVVYGLNPLYTDWREHALALLHQGLDIAEGLGAVFLFPGNVYNYGERMPPLLTETTPELPTTEKGQIRCSMEAELRRRAARGLRCRVIRAGDFFGSGRGSWFDLAIVKSLPQGKLVYPGPFDVTHAWTYVPDFAAAFVAVAARPEGPEYQAYNFPGHNLTGNQLLSAIEAAATRLGYRPPKGFTRKAFPSWIFRWGGLLIPMWREIAKMSYLWQVPHALEGSHLAQALGPIPSTPLEVALEQTLRDLQR